MLKPPPKSAAYPTFNPSPLSHITRKADSLSISEPSSPLALPDSICRGSVLHTKQSQLRQLHTIVPHSELTSLCRDHLCFLRDIKQSQYTQFGPVIRYVLVGNHYDAWTFGAVDPNSGTAAFLEVAQRFAKMQKEGWKPRRTIILCSWDAEEHHLIGSTEWVEDNREMLASRAVAYLNMDYAVSGRGFHASSTPQLDELLKEAAKMVQDPDNSSKTLYESWATTDSPLIRRLGGGGSDYAAFVQHVGVPSVDMRFARDYPVYHSMYDDFLWMQKFGDPLFHRHVAAASILGLVALKLADEEFLPFDYISYAYELQKSTKVLENELLGKPVSFAPLQESIEKFSKAASKVDSQRKELEGKDLQSKWKKDPLKVRELNDRLMMTERAFTDREGLFARPWFKHLVYGPSNHNVYLSRAFPSIDDAIEGVEVSKGLGSWQLVQREIWRVARVITQASRVLNGELT